VNTRRSIGKVAFCLVLAATAGIAWGGPLAPAPNEPAPPLRGYWHPTLEPHEVDWSAHKVTLVSFWADWCEPCKEMMPLLQKLHDERAAEGLHVIGVHNPETHPDKITEFLEPLNVSYPILRESKTIQRAWAVGILPTNFLIDDKGRILRRYSGGQAELVEALVIDANALMDGKPLGTMKLPDPPAIGEVGEDGEAGTDGE